MPTLPPTRKFTKGHFGKYLVYFPSRKNQCQVVCESLLEADYCARLEFTREVIAYHAQPETLSIQVDGRTFRYTPDFLVETSEDWYYTEVKPCLSKLPERYLDKLHEAKRILLKKGYPLKFADSESILEGPLLDNIKFLYFNSFNVEVDELNFCLKALTVIPLPTALGDFLTITHASPRALYRCIFEQKVELDLTSRITPNTALRKAP